MDCSVPGFPVLHYLLEFTQTYVHSVSDTIQTISSSVAPFSSCLQSFRAFSIELSLHIRWPKYGSFSFSISPSNEYSGLISFKIDLFLSPYCPRDSQESSLAPLFKSINSLALNFLYGPTLTTAHGYWKNHSFYCIDLCRQSDISAF